MKIVVDVRPMQTGAQMRGIGTYIRSLLYHLSLIDSENQYVLLQYADRAEPTLRFAPGFRFTKLQIPCLPGPAFRLNLFYDALTLERRLTPVQPDVIHFTSPIDARQFYNAGRLNTRAVATVHDMTPVRCYRETFRGIRLLWWPLYRLLFNRLATLGHLIAVSQTTADDVVGLLNVPRESVTVTLLGRPDRPSPARLPAESARETSEDYLAYVGELSPTKNPLLLPRLLARLQKRFQRRVDLVIIGNRTSSSDAVLRVAEQEGVADRIRFTGYIGDDERDLVLTDTACRAILFPSLYEGFGLPAVEAMDLGKPLLASSAGSLPEIVGDAGVILDPRDVDAWAEAVERVLSDAAFAQTLIERGRVRAAAFDWHETARLTLSVYQNIAARASSRRPDQ